MTGDEQRETALIKSDPNRLPREFGGFLLDFDRWERRRRMWSITLKYGGGLLVIAFAAVWLALGL